MKRPLAVTLLLVTSAFAMTSAARPSEEIPLWPGRAPGEIADLPPEGDTTQASDRVVAGKPVIRLGNVSTPTLAVYPAPADRGTGAAVVIFPGGGYHILAMDIEGTEVCEWLNSIGVTGIIVKYRVPRREGRPQHELPLQDAQRAMGLVRSRAAEWGIDPQRIGVLGFSAGAHLSAVLSNQPSARTYPRIDAADDLNCRPDFTVLIYPARLTVKDQNDAVAPELPVSQQTPPTFIAITQDDSVRVENALGYYAALHRAGVAAELHVYPVGGHGYGLRPIGETVATWPHRAAEWLQAGGWLRAQ